MQLYPLTFKPIFKEKIWGGEKISRLLGKDTGAMAQCGESWELSAVGADISVVASGPLAGKSLTELIAADPEAMLGKAVATKYQNTFPLLVKFLDANADLSVQVHPADAMAREQHGCFGKAEMWYIMQADAGSSLINGFSQSIDKEIFEAALAQGKLSQYLHRDEVNKGEVYYIPPGRIHTIGKGILLAEIQQSSDVTYRVYDYDRTDAQGNKRELHLGQAMEALDYNAVGETKVAQVPEDQLRTELVANRHFITNQLNIKGTETLACDDRQSFVVLTCVGGNATLSHGEYQCDMAAGTVLLIPAVLREVEIDSAEGITLLETYIPTKD